MDLSAIKIDPYSYAPFLSVLNARTRYIECEKLEPKQISNMLTRCPNLQVLRIRQARYKEDKYIESLGQHHKLQKLYLDDLLIETLDILEGFTGLTTFSCKNSTLKSLKGINHCPNLLKLDVSRNRITTLGDLLECKNLVSIKASHCLITSLKNICLLPKLSKLVVNSNKIISLKRMGLNPNLIRLSCDNNQLVTLSGIGSCPNLTSFSANSNTIHHIEAIKTCTSLINVDLHNNQLKSLQGIELCLSIEILNCSGNQLTSITELSACKRLVTLELSNNLIQTTNGIANCSDLVSLHINRNRLSNLPDLTNCRSLKSLYCCNNRISTLKNLRRCRKLEVLCCKNNWLSSLYGLENCAWLSYLEADHNQLTTISCIQTHNLTALSVRHNRLTKLGLITACSQLTTLDITGNRLQNIAPLNTMPILQRIYSAGNPLDYDDEGHLDNILHELFALVNQYNVDRPIQQHIGERSTSVYQNNQNVHDSNIQRSVCESVARLTRDPDTSFSIDLLVQAGINTEVIESIKKYCADLTKHAGCDLSYLELLGYVWARIDISEHKDDLRAILEQQVVESDGVCFTGRFNRLLSVLVGFYDDIIIEISDKSRIAAVILGLRERIEPYDPVTHREQSSNALLDLGYTAADIEPWLDAIEG